MKHILKCIIILIFSVPLFSILTHSVEAKEPTFSFYPNGGVVVNKDNGFIVDILIDSAEEEISSAKFTVLFDPEILQLKKAERNNMLFKQFPEDETTTDNENGVVMLSGFTQSGGVGELYMTGEKPDIFARLTFEVLQEGETVLDWHFEGTEAILGTAMLKDGSPPVNILLEKPKEAVFTIGNVILDPSSIQTSATIEHYIFVTGFVLILFGMLILLSKTHYRKKRGTVLLYEKE